MVALWPTEIHNITLENVALYRPILRHSLSTNQIARFGSEKCYRIFDSNDAVDEILNKVAAAGS